MKIRKKIPSRMLQKKRFVKNENKNKQKCGQISKKLFEAGVVNVNKEKKCRI